MKKTTCQVPTEKMSVIKQIRENLGMSQETFAHELDVSWMTVSRWERGKAEPNFNISQMKNFEKILKKAGLKLSDLPDTQWGEIPKLKDREKIAA